MNRDHPFTRADLLCVAIVLIIFAGWLFLYLCCERGRIAGCSRNLARIGVAMQAFSQDNRDGFPPAVIDQSNLTWDTLIQPYLRPELVDTNSPWAKRQLKRETAPLFLCASDPIVREHPRSYAMSFHDDSRANWPPGPENRTGIGIWWRRDDFRLRGMSETNLTSLSAVKRSSVPSPANTLLVTELIDGRNKLGQASCVRVRNPAEQMLFLTNSGAASFHHRRFNYLMADGHVELLRPEETGNAAVIDADPPIGIWSIDATD